MLLKKVFTSEIKGIDEKEGTLTAFVSTGAIDRMEESLDPSGADLSNYKKNPVVLWAHDYSKPPTGKALWIKKSGDGIMSKVKFANTPFGQEIFELYKGGFMKAFSVGFLPKEVKEPDAKGCKPQPKRTYSKWELLEYSAVPVPANPEALSLAVKKGILTEEEVRLWEEQKEEEPIEPIEPIAPVDDVESEESKEEKPKEEVEEEKEEKEEKEENIDEEDKTESKGFDELYADIEALQIENQELKDEITSLNYKLYELLNKQPTQPEVTVDNLANKVTDIINGVIRKAQGKIN